MLDFVRFNATDNVELQGWLNNENSDIAVVHLHGMSGNGYESRTLAKHTDGTWLDIVVFASTDDAQAALQGFNGNPHTKAFEECIDPQTARMNHWEIAKQY
jgi:hypothetical protein